MVIAIQLAAWWICLSIVLGMCFGEWVYRGRLQ
jgi:hypothetical protein